VKSKIGEVVVVKLKLTFFRDKDTWTSTISFPSLVNNFFTLAINNNKW